MKTTTENPADRGRYDRFRSEVVSGGSVTERDGTGADEAPEERVSPLTAVIAGIVIVGLLAWLAVTNGWMFIFVLGILVSVFLHETGHFVTARMTGMKATQFFLGFGPRLWSFCRGETEYGIRALPLGAFVRIIGMSNIDEVPSEDEARTYRQQSYPRRMLVISAGSIMHLLIALALLYPLYPVRCEFTEQPGAEVGTVLVGGP
ncbi:MAG: site-2 protease family protein, partial [Ilumatobacteraceae bacterium]